MYDFICAGITCGFLSLFLLQETDLKMSAGLLMLKGLMIIAGKTDVINLSMKTLSLNPCQAIRREILHLWSIWEKIRSRIRGNKKGDSLFVLTQK